MPITNATTNRLLLGASLAALLAGCMVGPDYVRPAAPTPEAYKEAAGWKIAQPADTAPRGDWWTVFNDPELDALVAEVEISNQTVAAAAARVREASAGVDVSRSALYPFVNLGGTAQRNKSSGNSGSGSSTNSSYNVLLSAGWEPDLWGGLRRGVESSNATSQATEADLAAAKLSLQASLAQTYLLLRVQDAQIALLEKTVSAYERSLQLTRNQYAAGIIARGDVAQAEAQLKSTQAQVIDARITRAQLEHAIAVLAGKPPAALSIAPRELVAVFPDVPLAVPSALLERRPDIAAAERRAASANAKIGVAQAAFYPALTLSANGGLQSSVIGSLLSLPNRYWSLGAALAQPLFDAGLRTAQKEQAIATYDETVANYRATVLTGFQEVEDNLVALHLLEQEAAVQDGAVAAARQSAEIALNQYKAGTTSFIAVVVLQAAELNSERTALGILGRRLTASVLLIKALGGGWNATALAENR